MKWRVLFDMEATCRIHGCRDRATMGSRTVLATTCIVCLERLNNGIEALYRTRRL